MDFTVADRREQKILIRSFGDNRLVSFLPMERHDQIEVHLTHAGNDGEDAFLAALADVVYEDLLGCGILDNVNTCSYDPDDALTQDDNANGDTTAIHALARQGTTSRLEAA
jgi:hypothetical protein